jgi:hypothetical protein
MRLPAAPRQPVQRQPRPFNSGLSLALLSSTAPRFTEAPFVSWSAAARQRFSSIQPARSRTQTARPSALYHSRPRLPERHHSGNQWKNCQRHLQGCQHSSRNNSQPHSRPPANHHHQSRRPIRLARRCLHCQLSRTDIPLCPFFLLRKPSNLFAEPSSNWKTIK